MAYSELIKNFDRIRSYMRDFFVFGMKRRGEYDWKSARSYDNERRRVESWLGPYMSFRQDTGGKTVFLSVDSRSISANPLYAAFKAKSFTANDIMLHFILLDILADGERYLFTELLARLYDDYLSPFPDPMLPDESTVRKKLREYVGLGLVRTEKQGKSLLYDRAPCAVDLPAWRDALAFFSETDPLGVIGSYLLDKLPPKTSPFSFKHHYILFALDSDILAQLLSAMTARVQTELTLAPRRGRPGRQIVTPLKLYISVQNGRQYVMAYSEKLGRIALYRADSIHAVRPLAPDARFPSLLACAEKFGRGLWGVSVGEEFSPDHLEMTLQIGPGEDFIRQRLEREKRHGAVETLDAHTLRYTVDVYDAVEMLPWLRTFLGRILTLQCTNAYVMETFRRDLAEMERMYLGGAPDAV